jgi:hypothetical protein
VVVEWSTSTGATIGSTSSTTNDDGLATPGSWTLSVTAGQNSLMARVPVIDKSTVFTASGTAGPPAVIAVQSGGEQSAAAGDPVTVLPSVRVVDAHANPVMGTTVTFAVTAGGGVITGATPTTNFNGVAAVGSWTLGAAGPNALTAAVSGLPAITITATATAPATQLTVTRQPDGAISGEPFVTQPMVAVRDDLGSVVTTSTAAVTASIASGSGTLSGTTTVNAVNGVATFTSLTVTGTSAVTLQFTATGLAATTSASFTPAPPPPLNLIIDNVHLTQATQTYAGTVPLVAGRAALARVFVKANVTNSAQPTVRLRTFVNSVQFREYMISPGSNFVTKTIDESLLQWSWNVVIPANEVVTGMTVSALVDPDNAIVESSDADNAFPASGTLALDVRQVPTMKVTFIPVTQPNVVAGNVHAGNQNAWLDYAKRVYPFDTVDVIIGAPYAYSQTLNGNSYDATWTTLLSHIQARRAAEAPASADRYYYGVAHPAYSSGGTGWGSIGNPWAIGVDFTGLVAPNTNYYSMTLAHEWGHNFNRRHIACGNPSSPDLNYPHDPLATIGAHGWDPAYSHLLYKATDMREFMSYCKPLWTSDYTYKAVMDWRATRFEPPPGPSQRSLLIWGHIGPSGVVLEPAYEIDAPVQAVTPGPYTIQALDEAGRQVFAVAFDGAPIAHAPDQSTFAFTVPLPSATSQPVSLRMLRGTQELTRRSRIAPLAAGGATGNAVTPGRLTRATNGRSRLEWDVRAYAGAMVRDPSTGEVLAFLRGGAGEIAVARDVDVLFSNGVTSVKQRLQIR